MGENMKQLFIGIVVVAICSGILLPSSTLASIYSEEVVNTGKTSVALHIQQSDLEIGAILSDFGRIRAEIKNVGDEDINEVEWSIGIDGGILDRLHQDKSGTLTEVRAGTTEIVASDTLFGLGDIAITVTANNIEKTVEGFIILFFIIIYPEANVDFETVASGLNSPVVLTHAGDGSNRLFVGDQIGKIYVIQDDTLLSEPFLDITENLVSLDTTYDERGLLGLVFHPDYETNGQFYVYYSAPKDGEGINHESRLSRFLVSSENPNKADPTSETILFRLDQPEANHNGGQLVFGPDGYLYFGLGDGGGAGDQHGTIGNGQDINTYLGSILRIDVDTGDPYAIPPDNPFVGREGLDEIYAWGFRNPWKFSFDRETERLFVADVGQDEWEEIDIVEKGGNYGWRIMEANHFYDQDLADLLGIDIDSLNMPIHEYNHDLGRSITGGYVYRGERSPTIVGSYVFGDWSTSFVRANGKLYYLKETEPGVWQRFELQPSQPLNRFVLSLGKDENGELYLLSKTTLGPSGTTGDVRRIVVN